METTQKGEWFSSAVIERKLLNHSSSEKHTYHIALDLTGSGICYDVGDCLKIMPCNDPLLVDKILFTLGLSGSEFVYDKQGKEYSIECFLTERANIHTVTKKLFTAIVRSSDEGKAHPLLQAESKEELKSLLERTELLSLLQEYRPILTAEQLVELLQPLLPRYYSIASSQKEVGEQAHLTVAAVGVASDYMCKQVELHTDKISIAHHRSPHFGLPKGSFNKPIIMIGPGTGIAPFIGFLQERTKANNSDNWLFFGERYAAKDFYYKEYLEGLVGKGLLKLDTAFSRDTKEKIYVQHRMYEKGAELWQWLHERGAYLFICGDKDNMAKAVDEMLLTIVSEQGKMDLLKAKEYLKALKSDKRILRDVY